MARAFPVVRAFAVVAAASLSLAACGSSNKEATPLATASSSAAAGDGTLKIGTLLPETGSLTILGPPEIAAVKLAVKDINAAGGVLGHDVLMESSDSGDASTNIATQSVNRLLDANVDAIVGAASSSVTLNVINTITGSGVLQISGANTSTTLTDYADQGLYFRTAPSDVYQGRVVGTTAAEDGAETLGILALQDAYGTSLADQASKAFTDGGGKMAPAKPIIYDPKANDYSSEVGQIKAADPAAIALIGFGPDTAKIIDEMVKQGLLPLKKSKKKLYFVDGNLSNTIDVAPGTLEGVKGTLPGSKPSDDLKTRLATIDPNLKDYSYAGEAYDAVMLVALAAEAAKSDSGKAIAAQMVKVSSGGTKCTTFAACIEMAKSGKDFDYDGLSGPIEFDENGNPTVASMGIYQYGADNKYAPLKFVKGPIAGGASTTEDVTASPTASADASADTTETSTDEPTSDPSASPSSTSSSQ
jgi:ABC-type branched-subunit amino acid transport system substrate-binding protein